MIKISQLTVIYPSSPFNVVANRGIDIEIAETGLLIITGPNGSGKSSLFKVLAGELSPASGQFQVNGRDIPQSEIAEQFSELFSYTAQDLSLNPRLSGEQHLKAMRDIDTSNLSEILDSLSITTEWKIPVRELARDKRQLVGISLSLLSPKAYLIFDEPTKYLNEGDRERLLKLFQQIATTRSVMIATHEPSWASLGKGSIHLQDGRVVQIEGRNISDKFGWTYMGEILKPTTLNTLKDHPNISIFQDLSLFNAALSSARGNYLVFDPESQGFDHITPVELFSFHQLEPLGSLGSQMHQRIQTFSGGERGWIYLCFLLAQKPEQLFLLYPSLNLDRMNHEKLQQLVVDLAKSATKVSIFDGS